MTPAQEVRALRGILQETTDEFGARWLCSGRTVEDWEQGRRRPNNLALDGIRKLAARQRKRKAARG
jgi:DNA-binding transcriptional regulator YiaG